MTRDPDISREARIAELEAELNDIHFANSVHWKQGKSQNITGRAEYKRRLDRLEEIRRELDQLQAAL